MSRYWEMIVPVAAVAMGTVVYLARRLARSHPGMRALTIPAAVAEAAHTLAESEEHRVRYGSMILDEEKVLHHEPAEWTKADLAALHDTGQRPRGMTDPDDLESSGPPGQRAPEGIPGSADGPRNMDATGAGDESEGYGLTAPPAPLWEYRAQNPDLAGGTIQLPRLGTPIRHYIDPDPMWPSLVCLDEMGDFPGFAFRAALPVELPPSNATDLALFRCDAFMASMRVDHALWLTSARERWAAA